MSYVDFFALPLPKGNEGEYKKLAEVFSAVMKPLGLIKYVEALADDVPRGAVTDFYRAVAATEEETVVAAFALWPDKETRDRAWAEGMKDPRMAEMDGHKRVFDGKRMFWGGFKPLIEIG
ncbi:MAG TPA: DUF1428 domain-containing protein [Polyangiaceae bacterium]|nr:DUF1428 domain-containing protein [Polyangiaceae bacterium]